MPGRTEHRFGPALSTASRRGRSRDVKSVLFVNQYFWPDMAATAQLLADLTKDLSERGLEVSVLTGKGSYTPGRDEPLPSEEDWKEIRIRRVWCTNFGRARSIGRLFDYLSFLVSAGLATVFGRRYDVVVCLSTPPLVALIGLLAKRKGARFVYKVEDLYPEVAVALGTLAPRSAVTRFFERISRRVLRGADMVVALDETMRGSVERRGARQVSVIPNWADGGWLAPDAEAGRRFRAEHDLEGRFIVLYSGNMGMVHRFDAVLEAAQGLSAAHPEVVFLFVGGGPRLDEIHKAAEGSPNILLMPVQARPRLIEVFNGGDLHLVTIRPEVSGLLVPSKYASALSVGKPVLFVGGGSDLDREIRDEGLGWVCEHDPAAVAAAVSEAASSPAETQRRGSKGRRLFETKYDRAIAVEKWWRVVTG